MKLNTSYRYIPSTYDKSIVREDLKAEVHFYHDVERNKFYAIAFKGKSSKPVFHYSYRSEESMNKSIENFFLNMESRLKAKIADREKKKAFKHNVKVGDIFHYSWGWEQTNCEFYEVVESKGKTVTLKSILAETVKGSDGMMCCRLRPLKGKFCTGRKEEVLKKRVIPSGDTPCIKMEFGYAFPTTENSTHYSSWYA